MSEVTEIHEEKETLAVDVNVPGHAPRTASGLFERSRLVLIARDPRCFICGRTAAACGHPLEAHHYPIEWSFAQAIDWSAGAQIRRDFPGFDWAAFDAQAPLDPYRFVDDMTVNGLLLCKDHHIGRDEGIHALPHPIWIAQRYALEGYQFSAIEIIHHPSSTTLEKGNP